MAFKNGSFVLVEDKVGVIANIKHPAGVAVHWLDDKGETLMRFDNTLQREITDEAYYSLEDLEELDTKDKRIPKSRRG